MTCSSAPAWQTLRSLPLTFLGFLSVVLVLTVRLPHLEGWDEAFYVAQMVSVAGDGDLMLHDDLLAFENRNEATRLRTILVTNPAREGALSNNFGIGPAMIHSFYLWPRFIDTRGLPPRLRIDYGLGSIGILALTILAMRTLLIDLGFGRVTAGGCAVAATYLGPLAIYGTRLQLNSHLPSALCGVLVLLFAWRWAREGGASLSVLLGLACGLAAVVRFQDGLLGLALAPFLLASAFQRTGERGRALGELGLAAVALAAVLAVQAIAIDRQTGQVTGMPQGVGYVDWANPQIAFFLFSPFHGLIPWTPMFALGLAALVFAARRAESTDQRWFFASLALLAVAECYISAAPTDWWGGSSFSARRLCTLTAPAAIGLAALTRAASRRLVLAVALAALCWSTMATSLFVRHFDDLGVVFAGQTSPESPLSLSGYPSPTRLGWPDFVRFPTGSFSLVDSARPSLVERVQGAAICVLICLCMALLWQVFLGSQRVRTAVAATAMAWTFIWLSAVWRAPSNLPANHAWLAIEQGTATEATLENLPPEVAASARVLLAWRAIREGQVEVGRRLLDRSRSPQFPAIGLADLALLDESAVRRGDR